MILSSAYVLRNANTESRAIPECRILISEIRIPTPRCEYLSEGYADLQL